MPMKANRAGDFNCGPRFSGYLAIKHGIPGRIRLQTAGLYNNGTLQERLDMQLQTVAGVERAQANTLTGSLLICYREDQVSVAELCVRVEEIISTVISPGTRTSRRRRSGTQRPAHAPRPRLSPGHEDHGSVSHRRFSQSLFSGAAHVAGMTAPLSAGGLGQTSATDAPGELDHNGRWTLRNAAKLTRWLWRYGTFVPLTGLMGYQLVQEYYYKRAIPQTPLSLTGVVSMIAAAPLLREAWRETFHEKRFTIHQFLAFSLVLGILVGEALAAFEVIYILRAGMLLEDYVANRSRRAIRRMLEVSVKDAHLLRDGQEVQTPIERLQRGDVVVVRTGEKIAVDGEIEKGEALVNESSITGRSEAVFKGVGDTVFAGSDLDQGVIHVRAMKVGENTYLSHIAALVDNSLSQKAPLVQRADQLASRLLKLGTIATLATLVITRNVQRAFSVMIVMSCPCATILAASTAVSAALHNATRRRILVKGGVYLEKIGEADVFCFDKTGTMTTEEPVVGTVLSTDEEDLFYWAASAELRNTHALAGAIIRHAESLGVQPELHSTSEHLLGKGVKATVGGCSIMLGNRRMMSAESVDLGEYERVAGQLVGRGETVVYVVRDGHVLGVIGIKHRLRPGADAVVKRLRETGVDRIYLVSGDERPVAEGLSRELSLDACYAELLPEEKARILERLRQGCGTMVMVGDGVNDALALAEADIGIAMGAGGSDVAIEVADIALADSEMRNLVHLRDLSAATLRVAEQNYYLAVGTNLAGVVLGAVGRLTPAMGGLIHIAHTVGIMLNSARLTGFRGRE